MPLINGSGIATGLPAGVLCTGLNESLQLKLSDAVQVSGHLVYQLES